jgi:hypothetical protein
LIVNNGKQAVNSNMKVLPVDSGRYNYESMSSLLLS